jgi:hypothetical protein
MVASGRKIGVPTERGWWEGFVGSGRGGDGGNCGSMDDRRERRGTASAAASRGAFPDLGFMARLDVFVCPTRATPKERRLASFVSRGLCHTSKR